MADFRRLLYAFAIVALLVGFTVPASAQSVLMTCSGSANNPLIRGEEYTALAGDIFVQCSGGIPTATGTNVPKVDVTVFTTTTTITSKLTDSATNFNEALLVIDEAGSAGSTNGLRNCGAASTGYDTATYSCNVQGVGDGVATYDGAAGHPNVFQGRQVSTSAGTAIQFLGVPLDPGPTVGGTQRARTMRITNLRVDATKLGIFGSSGAFTNAFISMTVNFNGTNFGGQQVISVVNGTVRGGLIVSSSSNSVASSDYLQCTAVAADAKKNITLSENFSTAFKVRNYQQLTENTSIIGGSLSGSVTFSAADLAQNVPNALYNTESGLTYPSTATVPSPNPPAGTGNTLAAPAGIAFSNGTGIGNAGTVTQGTRFYVKFGAVPAGSDPDVPNVVALKSNSVITGLLVLVVGADANGDGGAPAASTSSTSRTKISALTGGVAFYEVVFSNANAIETATITVRTNPTKNLAANPSTPEIATLSATAGFAPYYPSGVNDVNTAQRMEAPERYDSTNKVWYYPVPRFIDNQQASVALYDYNKCACNLLFPWVVGDGTFTTSLVIANTSLDPCNNSSSTCTAGFKAIPQSGKVTFWYFGTTGISLDPNTPISTQASQTSSASVPAGSYLAHIVSPSAAGTTTANGLTKLSANFAGYVIAQAQFQFCHGVASISVSSTALPKSQIFTRLWPAVIKMLSGLMSR